MKRGLLTTLVIACGVARGQQGAAPPEFEVADVQVTKPGSPLGEMKFLPGGKLQVFGATLKELITVAWNVEDDRVTGGPAWLDSDHFNIVAKSPHDPTDDSLRLMLQSLLAQRFGLAIHKEEKTMAVYALVVSKRGAKLQPSEGRGEASCPMKLIEGLRTLICKNQTMPMFAERIHQAAGAYLDHPVVDNTGIQGAFDFTVAWTGRGKLLGNAGRGGDPNAPPQASEPAGGLSVFDAVDKQLGLRLESQKQPLMTIVIDRVNRTPTEQ